MGDSSMSFTKAQNNFNLEKAIRDLYSATVTINFNEVDGGIVPEVLDQSGNEINWNESTVETERARLQAVDDLLLYARNRRDDYPNWHEQLNKIYDDGLTKWKSEMIDPIKTKWPKNNSGPVE